MKKSIITSAIMFVLCLSSYAAHVYQILDHNPSLADPLDKGFTVDGTITATSLGNFTESDSPFEDWNITVTAAGAPKTDYNFTPANSTWQYDTAGANDLVMVRVTENFIWLDDIFFTDLLEGITTNLFLESPSLNQQLSYINLGGSDFYFVSREVGGASNGSYIGGSGDIIVGVAIPEPFSISLIIFSLLAFSVLRRLNIHS